MSESDLFRTNQTHERNKAQGRIPPDRIVYSLSQVAEVTLPKPFFWFSYLLMIDCIYQGGTQGIRIESRV
jgi:hypothetical protein